MKIGISIYSYGGDLHCRKMTVHECLEHAASVGCDGVELIADQHFPNWPHTSPAVFMEMRKFVNDLGLKVACFSSYLLYALRYNRPQTRAEVIHEALKHITMAGLLGAEFCRPIHLADTKQDLIAIMKDCVPALEHNNVKWVQEVHSPFPPDYFNEVLDAVNSPLVRLLPDFSLWQTQGMPSEYSSMDVSTFEQLMPYVAYCHGKAHVFNEKGEEPNTPYQKLIQILKDHKYTGYVTAEYEGWMMREADSKQIVKTHTDLLKKYMN